MKQRFNGVSIDESIFGELQMDDLQHSGIEDIDNVNDRCNILSIIAWLDQANFSVQPYEYIAHLYRE